MPTKKAFFRYICDLLMQGEQAAALPELRPRRKQIQICNFQGSPADGTIAARVAPTGNSAFSHRQL
jgi:hypothetical protein